MCFVWQKNYKQEKMIKITILLLYLIHYVKMVLLSHEGKIVRGHAYFTQSTRNALIAGPEVEAALISAIISRRSQVQFLLDGNIDSPAK